MEAVLARVITITNEFWGEGASDSSFNSESAVCQDAMIWRIDVDDYVDRLEAEFGTVVRKIPWLHSTDQRVSFRDFELLLIPIRVVWRLLRWPFLSEPFFPEAEPENHPYRLTLSHIAAMIEKGEWFEP